MVRVLVFRLLENVRSVVVVVEVVEVVETSMAVIDIHVEAVVIMIHPDRAAIIHRDKAVIRVTG